MIFSPATMAAVLVDMWAQAAPESWVRVPLQFIQSIIPVAGGVGIAWMAFRWNAQKDHRRWILDQKKAEWREILDAIKVCEDFLPLTGRMLTGINVDGTPTEVRNDAYQRTRRVQQLFYDRLFVDSSALKRVLSEWNRVNEMIVTEEDVPSLDYTSAYIALVELARRAARKDLEVQD